MEKTEQMQDEIILYTSQYSDVPNVFYNVYV